ncbi:MAG: TIGR04086 family membrane protein [Bacillota bacterium]|nr:TIGR04086 family membrane protein [Bacillota bacterium]
MIKQTAQNAKAVISEHISLKMIGRGIIISYIITIPLFIIFAFILTYTDFPEKYTPTCVILVSMASITTAGAAATRKLRNKGWLNGSIVGLIYMLIMYLFGSIIFKNFNVTSHVVTMLIIGIIIGAIGGIIGINFKRNTYSKHF